MGLKRVQAGAGPYPADDFNVIVAAAEAWQSRTQNRGRRLGIRDTGLSPEGAFDGTVLVKNDSGGDRTKFSILSISGIVIDPGDDLAEFQREPVFACGLPAADSVKCVVLLEPVLSYGLGLAMLAGRTTVQVEVSDANHAYAVPIASDASKLASADSGPFRILWVESGTGTKWAAVLFPAAAAGAAGHRYFEITAGEGSAPPYVYSADEVEWSSSTHEFGTKSGGTTITGDLRSIQEQSGYPYAGKIPVGSVVDAWQEGTDWLCEVVYYKGVYPG